MLWASSGSSQSQVDWFTCVLDQLDAIVEAYTQIRPGSVTGPHTPPWNSVELEIHTPENANVIMTAARPRATLTRV
ncbi:hypothetical protein CH279_09145 [Rhodococcus sp. 06-412-2B]|nr:hypothetical protein CH279_09145 [Rhodococcus sp. 06-412-2B]